MVISSLFPLISRQAPEFVHCKDDASLHDPVVHMNESLLHIYSVNYPHPISAETNNECTLVIQVCMKYDSAMIFGFKAHKTYVDVIFVEGAFVGSITVYSLSNESDARTLVKPVSAPKDILRFVASGAIKFHAIIDYADWVENYKNSHYWNTFHIIVRAYSRIS